VAWKDLIQDKLVVMTADICGKYAHMIAMVAITSACDLKFPTDTWISTYQVTGLKIL
jgi:hypothetical protein